MIILNFTHPLTREHMQQIRETVDHSIDKVINVPTQLDHGRSFPEQIAELIDSIGLTAAEWQTTPLLINPPAFSLIAVTLLAELHGRMGYFPPVLRLRPVNDSVPPRFEVAEIVDLQAVRDRARVNRGNST